MKVVTTYPVTSTVLNKQRSGSQHSEWTTESITELMLGLLTTALSEVRDRRKSEIMRREAKEWLMQDDPHSPFSALNCCRQLGLDLHVLRSMANILMKGELYEI